MRFVFSHVNRSDALLLARHILANGHLVPPKKHVSKKASIKPTREKDEIAHVLPFYQHLAPAPRSHLPARDSPPSVCPLSTRLHLLSVDRITMSFKVFSDSTSTISSSSSSSFGYPTTSTAGRSILGKENIDPRGASSSSSKLKVPMKPKKMIKVDNGICTGTLRTKVIPDLPPLQPTSSKIFIKSNTSNKSSITILKRSKIITTTILDRRSASDSGYSNGSNCSSTTTTPTTPSSTSSPGQGTDGSGLEGETIKMLNDIIVESSRESTTSIATITAVDQTIIIGRDDLTYTNRLARGLTESPLAEVYCLFFFPLLSHLRLTDSF